jgi:hypothetical protein
VNVLAYINDVLHPHGFEDTRQWVGLQMLRDQIIAHTDLIFVDDAASTINIAGSGLTIDDFPNFHARTQDLVERVLARI